MLLVKVIVLLLLGFVVVSLFSGLFFLVRDKGQTNRTVNALSVRIGLSILAIVVVIIAGATGVIELNPSPLSERRTGADQGQGQGQDQGQGQGGAGTNTAPAASNPESTPGSGRRLATPDD